MLPLEAEASDGGAEDSAESPDMACLSAGGSESRERFGKEAPEARASSDKAGAASDSETFQPDSRGGKIGGVEAVPFGGGKGRSPRGVSELRGEALEPVCPRKGSRHEVRGVDSGSVEPFSGNP